MFLIVMIVYQDDFRFRGWFTSILAISCALYLEHDLISVFILNVILTKCLYVYM
nr:TPA_asm: hypothetical protein [Becan tricladivirus 2]